jgi:hypothetical protein
MEFKDIKDTRSLFEWQKDLDFEEVKFINKLDWL